MVGAFIKHSHNLLIVQKLSWTITSPNLSYSLLNNFLLHLDPPHFHVIPVSFIFFKCDFWLEIRSPNETKGGEELTFFNIHAGQ